MNIIDELEWRGAINQTTDKEALKELTENKNIGLYCGTDPTGDSLHIGHLIPSVSYTHLDVYKRQALNIRCL